MKKIVLLAALLACASIASPAKSREFETAAQAVANMRVGLNINNGLEEHYRKDKWNRADPASFETMTGRPVTTNEVIKTIADAGFGVVRVPVTWYPHMDPETGVVDKVWMDRVQEVVDYVLGNGMYCIINVHHDAGSKDTRWLIADLGNYDKMSARFTNLWKQVATRFKKYDQRLIFEGFNEIIDLKKSWSNAKVDGAYEAVNRLNQDFVNTVRRTGGNNKVRNLCVNTYATSTTSGALAAFVLPEDSAKEHLMMQVHSYLPRPFTEPERVLRERKQESRKEFYESDYPVIDKMFGNLKKFLDEKGYPCVLGEFGSSAKNNDDARARHAAYYVKKCKELGILPIYWYNPLERRQLIWNYPKLKDALIEASK